VLSRYREREKQGTRRGKKDEEKMRAPPYFAQNKSNA
jgi:hypothetical protein